MCIQNHAFLSIPLTSSRSILVFSAFHMCNSCVWQWEIWFPLSSLSLLIWSTLLYVTKILLLLLSPTSLCRCPHHPHSDSSIPHMLCFCCCLLPTSTPSVDTFLTLFGFQHHTLGWYYHSVTLPTTRAPFSAYPGFNTVLGFPDALLASLGLWHPMLGCHSYLYPCPGTEILVTLLELSSPVLGQLPALSQIEGLTPQGLQHSMRATLSCRSTLFPLGLQHLHPPAWTPSWMPACLFVLWAV